MNSTTNILLIMVIVLLFSIALGNSADNKVYANGSASSSPIILSVSSDKKDVFMVNVDKSIMLHYRVGKGFLLKNARRFDYDVQLINPIINSSGRTYAEIRQIVSKQK
ncbi:MAG: hypothetical protein COA79_23685 [Planctomycetota bacterium]|nr:MAG: hypothetical protein COA79_23685 [Planctomycetota bacterium]